MLDKYPASISLLWINPRQVFSPEHWGIRYELLAQNPSFDCNGQAGAAAAPAVEIKAQIFIVAICRVYNQPPRSDSMAGSGGRGCCTHSVTHMA